MSATLTVLVGNEEIVVRELTFKEVRDWLAEVDAQTQRDPVHATAFEDLGLDDLARVVDWSVSSLETCTPGQLRPVVEAAKRLNPHFFRIREALRWAFRQLMTAENVSP
jgi:hypothetical protein